ncbi:MAG: MFS transporter, partial [Syntrophorhabdales bacterium]
VAGLFGLIGVAGALTASVVGRATDRVSPRFTLTIAILLSALSYICLGALGHRIAALVGGVIALDIGMASGHISNQARIYALDPAARNRINAVYMVTNFIGGASGSLLGAFSWGLLGWHGVCAVELAFIAVAAAVHVTGRTH